MTMFFIKRLIGGLLSPLPVLLFLLFLALILLRRGHERAGGFAVLLAVFLLLLVSVPHPVRHVAKRLEEGGLPILGSPATLDKTGAIVILGNGVDFPGDSQMPALTRLNNTARARLVEGVRLARLFPEAKFVVCGNGLGLENCADAMAEAAAELGVDAGRILRIADAMDTEHEARAVRAAVGGEDLLLVTTAVHMKRALRLFRRHGMAPTPAPCDYIAPLSESTLFAVDRRRWRPGGGPVADNEETWHEIFGFLYVSWFGATDGL